MDFVPYIYFHHRPTILFHLGGQISILPAMESQPYSAGSLSHVTYVQWAEDQPGPVRNFVEIGGMGIVDLTIAKGNDSGEQWSCFNIPSLRVLRVGTLDAFVPPNFRGLATALSDHPGLIGVELFGEVASSICHLPFSSHTRSYQLEQPLGILHLELSRFTIKGPGTATSPTDSSGIFELVVTMAIFDVTCMKADLLREIGKAWPTLEILQIMSGIDNDTSRDLPSVVRLHLD